MAVKSHITDSATKITAEVVKKDTCGCQALAVATVPYREFENKLAYFSNDTYGIEMNQDAGFGVGAESVYTAEAILWVFNDIVGGGKTTPINDEHPHSGTYALKVDNSPVGDVYDFDNEADFDLTSHVAITMWIYVDKDWKLGDAVEFYAWDKAGLNAQVGTAVDLSDYFDFLDYDVYHKITIPLSDMGLTDLTIDSLRVLQAASEGKAPKYYLDDIQIETTGDPITYELKPDLGTWLLVKSFQIVCAAVGDATPPQLPYGSLLGVSIANGIGYKRITNGVTVNAATISKFVDFMTLSNATITGQGGDATNNWVSVNIQFNEEIVLKAEDEDKMTLTINDDLSTLLYFRVGVGSKVEQR